MAKRIDSRYEPGQRSGAWQKMRVNQDQEFVVGGYTPSGRNFDAIIFGQYDDEGRLVYVARARNGFTPASRDAMFKEFPPSGSRRIAHISGSRVSPPVDVRGTYQD